MSTAPHQFCLPLCAVVATRDARRRDLLSLQGLLATAQGVLAEKEGFLRQFLVDDKGCVLIACWGVPGRK
jgi:hypothetical protein